MMLYTPSLFLLVEIHEVFSHGRVGGGLGVDTDGGGLGANTDVGGGLRADADGGGLGADVDGGGLGADVDGGGLGADVDDGGALTDVLLTGRAAALSTFRLFGGGVVTLLSNVV